MASKWTYGALLAGAVLVLFISTQLTHEDYLQILAENPQDLILLKGDANVVELLGRSHNRYAEFYRWSYEPNLVKYYVGNELVDSSEWRPYKGSTLGKYRTDSPIEYQSDTEKVRIISSVEYFSDSAKTIRMGILERNIEAYPDTNKETVRWIPADGNSYRLCWSHQVPVDVSSDIGAVADFENVQVDVTDSVEQMSYAKQYASSDRAEFCYQAKAGEQVIDPQVRIGPVTLDYSRLIEGEFAYTPYCLYKCSWSAEFSFSRNVTFNEDYFTYSFKWVDGIKPLVTILLGEYLDVQKEICSEVSSPDVNGTKWSISCEKKTVQEWVYSPLGDWAGRKFRAGNSYRISAVGYKDKNDGMDFVPEVSGFNLTSEATWEGVTMSVDVGLVAYYDFNITNNGTELFQKDLNLTSNEGGIATSMLLVEDGWGNVGEGLLFTSINSNLSVDLRGKAFPNATTGGYTIMSCGIYNNTASVPNDMYIVQETQFSTMPTANLDEFGVLYRGSSGAAQRAAIEFVGDGQFTGTETAVPKTHYCQAFTINSGNGTEVLYFNATVTGSRADKGFDFGSGELAIGIINYYTGDGFSQGILDWFGVWNRSLNATEISCMVGSTTTAAYGNPLLGGTCGTVSNAAPACGGVFFNATSFTFQQKMSCTVNCTDADGGTLSVNTSIRNSTHGLASHNGSVTQGVEFSFEYNTTSAYDMGNVINCTVTANDDAASGSNHNSTIILGVPMNGTVLSSDGDPLQGAKVFVENMNVSILRNVSTTDGDGNWNTTISRGCYQVGAGIGANITQGFNISGGICET